MLRLRLARIDACLHGVDAAALLSAAEHARWAGFASPRRQRQFLAGRRLLRELLDDASIAIGIAPGGAPIVEVEPARWISLSHSGDWVAAAVADRPVGLDIEQPSRKRDRARLAEEIGWPRGDAANVYTGWTLKEAALKRRGLGLDMTRLRAIGVRPVPADQADALTLSIEPGGEAPRIHVAVVAQAVAELSLDGVPARPWGDAAYWRLTGEGSDPAQHLAPDQLPQHPLG